ncbi:MAG TPA: exodeoxyribonuclease V subunit gamma [Candidatus Binataceae bacterium]|nr:exodeoxyribonuclease V subunit gamma [Candidatus Binataceae bacterium]
MLKLHYSNQLDGLIDPLASAIAARQRIDALGRISIVVPNRAVEQFVSYAVAERLGVAANLEFPFLRAHLAAVAQQASLRVRVLTASALQIIIVNCLMSAGQRDNGALAPAYQYIDADSGGRATPEAELRCFDLAGRLAKLFEEYSISRRVMLAHWRHGRLTAAGTAMAQTEKWQQALWRSLFNPSGAARTQWTGDDAHEWMALPDAFASASDAALAAAAGGELHVFGLASPGQAFAEIFARLGRLGAISIYALNPCREFWEDLDSSRRSSGANWAHRTARLGAALDASEDPFGLSVADNRALELWGRPGREYIRLLNELSDCDFDSNFIDHPGAQAMTLLARFQQDILDRAPAPPSPAPAEPEPSIRFFACPGVRREVEIVASEIWRIVKQSGTGAAPIRFHEIAVLIPDAECQAYAPHIESVFARMHDIPVEISGRSVARQSRVAEAIVLLLRLPRGHLTRTDLLRLLKHPALRGGDAKLDAELWDAWCDEAGVFFGAGEEDLAATYIPPNLFNWDQALKRIALGAFMSGERSGDDRIFDSPATGALLPLEIDQDEMPEAYALVSTARALLADAHALRSALMNLAGWSRAIARMIERYVIVAEPEDQRIRDRCLAAIGAIGLREIETPEVSYPVAQALAAAAVEELGMRQVHFAGHGVAAGPMSILHSLPFRAIFAIGMGESFFPARDPRDPLDLRQTRRSAGDVSTTDRDRYLFLESILGARGQIAFSYVARDSHSGDSLEPSTVIRELQLVLGSYLSDTAVNALTVAHPMSRYDLAYHSDLHGDGAVREGGLVNFDDAAQRGACATALRDDLITHAPAAARLGGHELLEALAPQARNAMRSVLRIPGPRPAGDGSDRETEIYLPVSALKSFLECPAQGAARYAMGMSEDDEPEGDLGDEPAAISSLDHAMLLREVFWTLPTTRAEADAAYRRAATLAQMKGRAPVGPIGDWLRDQDVELILDWRAEADAARAGDLSRWKEYRLGRSAEAGSSAQEILPYLALEVPVRIADGKPITRRVRLHGGLGRFSPGLEAALQGVARKDARAKHFLPLFLNTIVLEAAGQPAAQQISAILLGAQADKKKPPPWIRTAAALGKDRAIQYLTAIASDLLSGPHDYFLPIEAAEMYFKAVRKNHSLAGLVAMIETLRDNERHSCSSEYGPLRRWRELEPPATAKIKEILKRRFGPIVAIFGVEEPPE